MLNKVLKNPQKSPFKKKLFLLQHNEGISAVRVFAMAGGTEPEPVWELVGYTHDTDDLWDLGQVKIPLASQVSSKYFLNKLSCPYSHLSNA